MRVEQWTLGPMQNLVYLFTDDDGVGFLVDPAFEVPRLLELVRGSGARVTHVLATHGHPDHVQGIPEVKRALGATVVAHPDADHGFDLGVGDRDRFRVGALDIEAIHTPGHRFDAVCYLVNGTHLLTGDTLFVGECGRVDLPGSDVRAMHRTLTGTLRALPDDLVVLPGHDYGATPTSMLGREKRENYTMKERTLDEFVRFMAE